MKIGRIIKKTLRVLLIELDKYVLTWMRSEYIIYTIMYIDDLIKIANFFFSILHTFYVEI